MTDGQLDLIDHFLVRHNGREIVLDMLTPESPHRGILAAWGETALVLTIAGEDCLVFYSAIATIKPGGRTQPAGNVVT